MFPSLSTTKLALAGLLLGLGAAACASAETEPGPSGTTTSTGAGGDGGGTAGAAGDGGGETGGSGGGGAGGGEACASGDDPLLLLGTGTSSSFGAHWDAADDSWCTRYFPGVSGEGTALAVLPDGRGLGVHRSTQQVFGEFRYVRWTQGSWGNFAVMADEVTSQTHPGIAAGLDHVDVLYNSVSNHYHAAYNWIVWGPQVEEVGTPQSQGPSTAAAVVLNQDLVIAFASTAGDIVDQTRIGGIWGAAVGRGLGNVVTLTPAMVALSQGPELLIVFVRQSDGVLMWSTRSAGVWSAPQAIAGAVSTDPPAMAALPNGEAIVGYRGDDGRAHATRYAGGGSPWSTPATIGDASHEVLGRPAVARGVDGIDAELAFVHAVDRTAFHARLEAGGWTMPTLVGGLALRTVALGSAAP